MKKTVEEMAAKNVQKVLDEGPGLRYSTNLWVGEVRGEGENEEFLVCGLGGMGVGSMWCGGEEHRKYPGYEQARAGLKWNMWHGCWTIWCEEHDRLERIEKNDPRVKGFVDAFKS